MKDCWLEVEDRETAYLFLHDPGDGLESGYAATPKFTLSLEGITFTDSFSDELSVWLMNDKRSHLRVVPRESFVLEDCGTEEYQIPSPIVVWDQADFELHQEQ